MSAIALSWLALVLAALSLAPGMDFYNDAGQLVRTEPAFPYVLAVGALGFAGAGVALVRWPSPSRAVLWIAAAAGGVALWLSEHLLDNLFLHGVPTLAGQIAGLAILLTLVGVAVLAVTCLAILGRRAIQRLRRPAEHVPML